MHSVALALAVLLLAASGSRPFDDAEEEEAAQAEDEGVRGGPYVPACEQITLALDKDEACNVDEFRTKAWITAVELDCQLNKAQGVLNFVAKKYQSAAKASYSRWEEWYDSHYERQLSVPSVEAAEIQCESVGHPGPGSLVRRRNLRRRHNLRRGELFPLPKEDTYEGAPTWCDLKKCCRSCAKLRYEGPLAFGQLLLIPQPSRPGGSNAFAYDAHGKPPRTLKNTSEVTDFDFKKINRGLWFATVLGNQENFTETEDFYFSEGVQSRLRYRGNDPAILVHLTPRPGDQHGRSCNPAPGRNLIDPGNARYFNGRLDMQPWPYWQAPHHTTFMAVASRLAYDQNDEPMGTLSIDVNMSALTKTFLDKLSITKKTYAVLIEKSGRIIMLSERARSILFTENLTDEELFAADGRPRCREQLTADCTWDRGKAMSLSQTLNRSRFSGSNISGILNDMFDGSSNCSNGMNLSHVHFPKAKGDRKWHVVAYCAFTSVPLWGVVLGTEIPDLTQASRMAAYYLTASGPATVDAKTSLSKTRVFVNFLLDASNQKEFGKQVFSIGLRNTGRIRLPYYVSIPPSASDYSVSDQRAPPFAFITKKGQELKGVLDPGEETEVNLTVVFPNLTLGKHTEWIFIKADEELPRGTCYRGTLKIRMQLDVEDHSFKSWLLKDHAEQVLGLLIVLVMAVLFMPMFIVIRSSVKKHYKTEALQRLKLEQALDIENHIAFPMVLMTAFSFKSLGGLVSHEELMKRHEDVWLYTVREVREFSRKHKVVFISHQWTAFGVPDPTNIQYEAMVMSIETLRVQEGWDEEQMYVWVDYSSIPQKHRGTQTLAINSLTVYASNVAAFVVVAPLVNHRDLHEPCDKVTYQRRAWCRAEQLAHLLALGPAKMYLAESGTLTPLTELGNWLEQSQYVFQGDLTCCRREHEGMDKCDKELLVVPMLGLWAQLCQRCREDQANPDQLAIHASISKRLNEVFPRTFTFVKKGFPDQERTLFGSLTDRLQRPSVDDAGGQIT